MDDESNKVTDHSKVIVILDSSSLNNRSIMSILFFWIKWFPIRAKSNSRSKS
uniref:Uncharacterized protein n=1 Tax=Nelumbo nucifera TaxID=4432 RepID=A0A822ZBF0_NELNU|nr:TPA_asm: hypothetical protein HUJ06_001804 [Nelumbo nucifera]